MLTCQKWHCKKRVCRFLFRFKKPYFVNIWRMSHGHDECHVDKLSRQKVQLVEESAYKGYTSLRITSG